MERLIGDLFANLGETDWASAFLAGVCAETRSHAAAVLQVDVATRRQTLPAFFGQGADMALAFELTHAAGNPWRPADERQGPAAGSVVVPDDVLPLAGLRRTPFWRDFLRPMDVDHGAGIVGERTADRVVSLTLLRSARRGAYGADERAWLSQLGPHWANACRLRGRLTPADGHAWDAVQALDRLGTAVFCLDERGRCTRWNAAAEALLRSRTLLRLQGGRLTPVHPTHASMHPVGPGPAALHERDGRVAAHLAMHPLPGGGAFGSVRSVVFVEPIEAVHAGGVRHALATVYGLTPREAELAARLADGADLAEAAAAMGVTAGAARTRLKSVFGKTGVRHQGALVSTVRALRSVV
ncbi:MAG: hypothetical protein JNN30_05470 [Rhodanobacteraceae bacterium]|nr:hypothetical protein [Rhodanobacteraceae bacterium]